MQSIRQLQNENEAYQVSLSCVVQWQGIQCIFCCKNSKISTISSPKAFIFAKIKLPAALNARSEGTDVAGIQKSFFTSWDRIDITVHLPFHHQSRLELRLTLRSDWYRATSNSTFRSLSTTSASSSSLSSNSWSIFVLTTALSSLSATHPGFSGPEYSGPENPVCVACRECKAEHFDGRTEGRKDGRTDGQIDRQIFTLFNMI